ncbi:MAG TPA: ABC transporter permease [Thermoanaerobaculia bacterium]|nr:ABC transporter permease [Thermoanaerobaculia bacterium]
MKRFLGDLRFAWRTLRNSPTLSLLSIVVLGIGIGATSTIFSAVYGVLLRPMPYEDPDRLVQVLETRQGEGRMEAAPANWVDWRRDSQSFGSLAAYRGVGFNVTGGEVPQRVGGARVSADFFDTLGARPALGRTFRRDEEQPGSGGVVVLSHAAWERRFDADPNLLGERLVIDGRPHQVIGVLPPDFVFLPLWRSELYVPLVLDAAEATDRDNHWLYTVGRLAPGVSASAARQEMEALAETLARRHPGTNTGAGVRLVPLRDEITGPIRSAVVLLLFAVGLVLLLTCANVAVMLLARAAAREREIALRVSLGAARRRLVAQLLTESLLLSLLGGALGIALAVAGIHFLVSLIPPPLSTLVVTFFGIGMNLPVLVFTVVLSAVTALIFGTWPALKASRPDLSGVLKDSGGRSRRGMKLRGRGALVALELVLAVVLLVTAALLIRSFLLLQTIRPGFESEGVLTAAVELSGPAYHDDGVRRQFLGTLLDEVGSLPGVESAAAVSILPLTQRNQGTAVVIEGRSAGEVEEAGSASYLTATPGYFETFGIGLLRGEGFGLEHGPSAPRVTVINQAMAQRLWPGEDAVGKQLILTRLDPVPRTVIGVTENVRYGALGGAMPSTAYVPYAQDPRTDMVLVLRSSVAPETLVPQVRERVWGLDGSLPLEARTMESVLDESLAQARFPLPPLAVFALIALLLAGAGIYGVVSFAVVQRAHEIGIRVALGARRQDVLRLVLAQSARIVVTGLLIGLVLSFLVSQALSGVLYGVRPGDPTVFLAVPSILLAVALFASYLPARRATRLDPAVTLRQG